MTGINGGNPLAGPDSGVLDSATLVPLTFVHQERGDLLAGQWPEQVPFAPQRFFVVSGVPADEKRGQHAHLTCHQFLVALQGSLMARVWDSAGQRDFVLDSPDRGLYMPPMTYGTQQAYSRDAVLLVLASHTYDINDYLDSFEEFRRLTGWSA